MEGTYLFQSDLHRHPRSRQLTLVLTTQLLIVYLYLQQRHWFALSFQLTGYSLFAS